MTRDMVAVQLWNDPVDLGSGGADIGAHGREHHLDLWPGGSLRLVRTDGREGSLVEGSEVGTRTQGGADPLHGQGHPGLVGVEPAPEGVHRSDGEDAGFGYEARTGRRFVEADPQRSRKGGSSTARGGPMKWPWNRDKTPSALAQTTDLIRTLIEEHEHLVENHQAQLASVRETTELQEARSHRE